MEIKYPVFNPMNGLYTTCDTLELAVQHREVVKQEYLAFQNIGQQIVDMSFQESDNAIANEFLAIKTGTPEIRYGYSVYNSTIEQIISRVFINSEYFVKVLNGSVSEWYEINGSINGVQHAFVALSIETDEPIEYYDYNAENALVKYSLDGTPLAQTISCTYDSLDASMQEAIADFQFKNTVFMYSQKAYGLVFECNEILVTPYDQCNADQKQLLDEQRQEFLNLHNDIFVINQETIDDQGNSTWTLIEV